MPDNKIASESDVTVVLTACGRPDLLDKTLESFLRFNTHRITEYLITEDSGTPDINAPLKRKYAQLPITWIDTVPRRGQLACIDDAYSRVTTPYIFHCEDDWEFYRPGFIEKSKAILHDRPGILQVWLRAEWDTNGHPLEDDIYKTPCGDEVVEFRRLAYNYGPLWHGFSFNPGLRRLQDYRILGTYKPYRSESGISCAYKTKLYSAVLLCGEGYVRHIGDGRHVAGSTSDGGHGTSP